MADAPADTPALDALLREVDKLAPWQDATGAPLVPLAPRLAAIVRVLRAHVEAGLLIASDQDAARTALARAEAAVASGRHGGRQVAEYVAGRIEARSGTAPKEAPRG